MNKPILKSRWKDFLEFMTLINQYNISDVEFQILVWRFFCGLTLEECGKMLDKKITRERVRQIEGLALQKLSKDKMLREYFKEYLGA